MPPTRRSAGPDSARTEFSIYLARGARGRGLGHALLEALVDAARASGRWKLVSRIFPSNHASRSLCRSTGFREVGVYRRHACLDGRWLDVVIVERLIEENQPVAPPPRLPDLSPSQGVDA
jgi:L-amino acid N-acyltransferase YncA